MEGSPHSYGIFLISVIIGSFLFLIFLQAKRIKDKKKNLYDFDINGWSVLKDDGKLYELEILFTASEFAKELATQGFTVENYHSILKRDNFEEYTGFIALIGYQPLIGTVLLEHSRSPTTTSEGRLPYYTHYSYRFYVGTLKKSTSNLIHIHSGIFNNPIPAHLTSIAQELKDLETMSGFKKWEIIANGNQLMIVSAELREQKWMEMFLNTCTKINIQLSPFETLIN
jgi:hypothetical protein